MSLLFKNFFVGGIVFGFVCLSFAGDDTNNQIGKIVAKQTVEDPRDELEIKITKKLERLRRTMPFGNPKRNIPILDPFTINNISINFDRLNFRIKGIIEDLKISGLKHFYVDKLKLHLFPAKLDLDITLPGFEISADNYNIKAKVAHIIPIFGKGQFLIKIHRFKIKTFLKISLKEKFIRVVDVGVEPYINGFQFMSTGIFGSNVISKFFNDILTIFFPKVFNRLQKFITKQLSQFGLDTLRFIFGDITVREVLQILESTNDGLSPFYL